MNVEQLRAFVKVADSHTISAAASSLFVSQPSLSRSIARLERELGVSLFERGRKGCELTEAGAAFLPHARRALCELDRGLSSLLERPENALILGCTVEGLLTELLPGFIHARPDVAIDQRTVNEGSAIELIQSGSIDILISADIINARDVMCVSVDGAPYALYCSAASRWARYEHLELSQLAEASFICDTSRMSRNELSAAVPSPGLRPASQALLRILQASAPLWYRQTPSHSCHSPKPKESKTLDLQAKSLACHLPGQRQPYRRLILDLPTPQNVPLATQRQLLWNTHARRFFGLIPKSSTKSITVRI